MMIEIKIGDHVVALVTTEEARRLIELSIQKPGQITFMEISLEEPRNNILPLEGSSFYHVAQKFGVRVKIEAHFVEHIVGKRLHDFREERK